MAAAGSTYTTKRWSGPLCLWHMAQVSTTLLKFVDGSGSGFLIPFAHLSQQSFPAFAMDVGGVKRPMRESSAEGREDTTS